MKNVAFVAAAFVTAACLFAFVYKPRSTAAFDYATYKRYTQKAIVGCSPDWSTLADWLDQTDIMPMPGAGNYKWTITTTSDSAQFYFNQGINMYYGFHIIEAMASFKKAARFDAQSPMVWWAQALTYGPNINDIGYNASPQALDATGKAVALLQKATPVEKALIVAMQVRYSNDSTETRASLNQAYTDAMKRAYTLYPTTPDVVVLYADAQMLQHPWDLWNTNGTPKPWTPQIETVLEKALVLAPLHPGANHYYIHVMEPSPYASKALPSAQRLGSLTPGLSHMVHMPSHIYLRMGQYNEGVRVNDNALTSFKQYSALFSAANDGVYLYQWHNQHMQVACALLAGRNAYTLETALALQQVIDTSQLSAAAPAGAYMQYIHMTPVLVNIRFEKWDALLAMPTPAAQHTYASILYHFGRGMACTGKNNLAAAQEELQQVRKLMKDEDLKIPFKPFSAAIEGATCAAETLEGFIGMKQQNFNAAIAHFTKAVQTEEAMVYNEPRDWLLNPKQYLGIAYLKAGQYGNAEAAFKKDLQVNAKNIWSLHGLEQALQKQHKTVQAQSVKKQLNKADEKSDVNLNGFYF